MALTKKQQLNELLQAAIDSYQAGRIDAAIAHLIQNAGSFPTAAKLWGYLGFLHGEAGEHLKAARAFRRAANISPHSEQASLGLFHSLWRSGKTNAAFDEMRRFVKSNDSPSYRQLIRDMLAEKPVRQKTSRKTLVVA
jgi:tetratricopeptide (TPR) repeat protein